MTGNNTADWLTDPHFITRYSLTHALLHSVCLFSFSLHPLHPDNIIITITITLSVITQFVFCFFKYSLGSLSCSCFCNYFTVQSWLSGQRLQHQQVSVSSQRAIHHRWLSPSVRRPHNHFPFSFTHLLSSCLLLFLSQKRPPSYWSIWAHPSSIGPH